MDGRFKESLNGVMKEERMVDQDKELHGVGGKIIRKKKYS